VVGSGCLSAFYSITAALPYRIYTGFPILSGQVSNTYNEHLQSIATYEKKCLDKNSEVTLLNIFPIISIIYLEIVVLFRIVE
jgi:hypothetical protein